MAERTFQVEAMKKCRKGAEQIIGGQGEHREEMGEKPHEMHLKLNTDPLGNQFFCTVQH